MIQLPTTDQETERIGIMPENQEWITLSEAARLAIVPVARNTLLLMIKDGRVPDGHWKSEPFWNTETRYYFIDKNILPMLLYKKSGKRGKDKRKRSVKGIDI